MLNLISYESSAEEDNAPEVPKEKWKKEPEVGKNQTNGVQHTASALNTTATVGPVPQRIPASPAFEYDATAKPPTGPALGPAGPIPRSTTASPSQSAPSTAPPSPYTSNRQLLHSLTLPTHANLTIPPSPPGTPPPTTTSKISKFLDLKSTGIHFNAKLASSSALRNPSLFRNLLDFAGVDEEYGQYASTLPVGLAPMPPPLEDDLVQHAPFPKWAYVEELNRSQAEISKRREAERGAAGKRDAIDFIPATTAKGTQSESSTRKSGRGEGGRSGGERDKLAEQGARSVGGSNAKISRFQGHDQRNGTGTNGKRTERSEPQPRRSRFDERSQKRRKDR